MSEKQAPAKPLASGRLLSSKRRTILGCVGNSVVDDLTYLPSGGGIPRPEGPVGVTRDYRMVIGRFDIAVERIVGADVREVRPADRVYVPALGQVHDLGKLRTRDIVAPSERSISIP